MDVFHKGATVVLGVTGRKVCPVATILSYMANPRPAGSSASGPFFVLSDGRALTRERFVKELRVALKQEVLGQTTMRATHWSSNDSGQPWNARFSDKDVGTMGKCCIYITY